AKDSGRHPASQPSVPKTPPRSARHCGRTHRASSCSGSGCASSSSPWVRQGVSLPMTFRAGQRIRREHIFYARRSAHHHDRHSLWGDRPQRPIALGLKRLHVRSAPIPGRDPMTTAPAKLHRVVIVGAGFGGLETTYRLAGAPVEITLIDRRNHHLFQPLLYQVATASLATSEIAWPIRYLLRNRPEVTTLFANVNGVDPA